MKLSLIDNNRDAIDVRAGDRTLFAYVYNPAVPRVECPKPYIHPVHTLGGELVTMLRPHDHPWHSGFSMTCTSINDENFWGGYSWVQGKGYEHINNYGQQRHLGWLQQRCDGRRVALTERLAWETIRDEVLIEETREIGAAIPAPEENWWLLQLGFSLKNVSGRPLEFSSPTVKGRPQAGYGGLFWRGPRCFDDGKLLASDDRSGPELMGECSPWLAFVGRHDQTLAHSTLVFADDAHNLRHPTKWFVRNTPIACASAAFMFDQAYTLPVDETLTLRYQVLIADGAWDAAQIERALSLARAAFTH